MYKQNLQQSEKHSLLVCHQHNAIIVRTPKINYTWKERSEITHYPHILQIIEDWNLHHFLRYYRYCRSQTNLTEKHVSLYVILDSVNAAVIKLVIFILTCHTCRQWWRLRWRWQQRLFHRRHRPSKWLSSFLYSSNQPKLWRSKWKKMSKIKNKTKNKRTGTRSGTRKTTTTRTRNYSSHNAHIIIYTVSQQEAQLMLTTGSTRLAVSRGQQTRYHSTCCTIVTLSLRRAVFTIFVFTKFHDLEMGSKVTQGHWEWYHSIDCVWFPISVL